MGRTMTRSRATAWTCLAILLATCTTGARADDDAGAVAGVWGAERVLPAAISGTVTVVRTLGRWTARAGGFDAEGGPGDGRSAFRFPGGRGELRADPARGRGYWIQPPSEAGYGAYASPLRLTGG